MRMSERFAPSAMAILFTAVAMVGGVGSAHAQPSPVVGGVGQICSTPGRVGVDGLSGDQLVCTYVEKPGGYKWVRTAPILGVHNIGTLCKYPNDNVSQTPGGIAVHCDPSSNKWVGP